MFKYIGLILVAFIIIAGGWWLLGTDRGSQLAANDGQSQEQSADHAAMDSSETADVSIAATMSVTDAPDVTFNVTGKNFEFSSKEIRVKEGDVVQINFTSESGTHDWVVDEFDARTEIVQTGNSSSVTFVADKKGTFEYYCSVGQHRINGMIGRLIVE